MQRCGRSSNGSARAPGRLGSLSSAVPPPAPRAGPRLAAWALEGRRADGASPAFSPRRERGCGSVRRWTWLRSGCRRCTNDLVACLLPPGHCLPSWRRRWRKAPDEGAPQHLPVSGATNASPRAFRGDTTLASPPESKSSSRQPAASPLRTGYRHPASGPGRPAPSPRRAVGHRLAGRPAACGRPCARTAAIAARPCPGR